MKRILLATRNPHKEREISEMLGPLVSILSLRDFPLLPETIEDQPTLEANAAKKAREAALQTKLWALADDTGLEVEALGGAPGVFSARYAGERASFEDNTKKLLRDLSQTPPEKRKAVFRTVIALSSPEGKIETVEGRIAGMITESPRGKEGFGYDPVFWVPSRQKTLAEMDPKEKNSISHRSLALKKIISRVMSLGLFLSFLFPLSARADINDANQAGSDTIWDQMMASQAGRNVYVGSEYLQRGNYDIAAEEFGRAVADNPQDPKAHMMLGVAYYWLGEVKKSLEQYQASLELDPKSAQVYMLIGISLAWEGNNQGAYQEFETAAKLNPSRPDIQMNLGSVEETLGKIQDALEHLREAVSLDPKYPLYHYQLGMLYRRLGRYTEATDEFAAALEIFPDYEDALLEMGSMAERDHHFRKAMDDFSHAVDLKERDSVARLLLAHLYLLENKYKDARLVMANAFDLTPKEGGPGLRLSLSYSGGKSKNAPQKNQKPQKPRKNHSPTAKPQPKSPSNDPLNVFKKNLERIPLNQGAILQVEVVFMPKPKLKLADNESNSSLQKELEKKLGDQQATPQAVQREYPIHAGNAQERKAEIAQIIKNLKQTLNKAPPNSNVRFGMNLTYKNLEHVSTGGARPTNNPLNVSYQPHAVGNDLGLWIMGTGWMDLVSEILPKPGQTVHHPDQTDWWTEEGLGYATLGKGPEALADFERACRLDPNNDVAWLGRAVASIIMGDEKGALKYLRKSLSLNPQNKTAKEGLKWLLKPSAQTHKGPSQQ